MVERDAEIGEVALVRGLDRPDEVFRRQARLLGGQHDRRAVRIVGADVVRGVTGHALRAHPDVALDVADQVTEVQMAVGVGQGGGDEKLTTHADAMPGGLPIMSRRAVRSGAARGASLQSAFPLRAAAR